MKSQFSAFTPTFWNDQVSYWHETATFISSGFNGGYYSVNEHTAPISFFHFGSHGPAYAVIYGAIGKLIGWNFNTPLFINMVFFALACFLYISFVNLKVEQLLLAGGILFSFFPIYYYTLLVSQEPIHYAASMLLAAFFTKLLSTEKEYSWKIKIVGFIFLTLMAYIRITWSLLFFPFFLLVLPKSKSKLIVAISISFVLFILLFYIYNQTSVVWNNHLFYLLVDKFRSSIIQGLLQIWTIIYNNFIIAIEKISIMKISVLIQALILLMGFLLLYKKYKREHAQTFQINEPLFHLWNLGLLTTAVLLLYFGIGGDRILIVGLLFTFMMMIPKNHKKSIILIILINLLFLPSYTHEAKSMWSNNTRVPPQEITALRSQIEKVIKYDPNQKNPWCNTLLMSLEYYSVPALAMPSGIGLSFIWPGTISEIEHPFKSKYIMIDNEKLMRLNRKHTVHFTPLLYLDDGAIIFKNEDAYCQ